MFFWDAEDRQKSCQEIRQSRCHIGMQGGELGLDPAGYVGLERGLCVHVGAYVHVLMEVRN